MGQIRRRLLVEALSQRLPLSASGWESAVETDQETSVIHEYRWHNQATPEDVDGDAIISATDALIIINDINSHGVRWINDIDSLAADIDVNSDGTSTVLDALIVINRLNADSRLESTDSDETSIDSSENNLDNLGLHSNNSGSTEPTSSNVENHFSESTAGESAADLWPDDLDNNDSKTQLSDTELLTNLSVNSASSNESLTALEIDDLNGVQKYSSPEEFGHTLELEASMTTYNSDGSETPSMDTEVKNYNSNELHITRELGEVENDHELLGAANMVVSLASDSEDSISPVNELPSRKEVSEEGDEGLHSDDYAGSATTESSISTPTINSSQPSGEHHALEPISEGQGSIHDNGDSTKRDSEDLEPMESHATPGNTSNTDDLAGVSLLNNLPISNIELSGRLTGSGRGKVKFEIESGKIEFELEIQALPNSTIPVFVGGVTVGSVTTNSSGRGKLKFKTGSNHTGQNSFPAAFPAIANGTTVRVGNILSGSLGQKPGRDD